MSRIAVRIGGGRGGSAAATTAITVALILILIMASSPAAILTTTTEAFAAASKSNTNSNNDCNPLKFSGAVESTHAGKTVTIATSQNEYSVKLDYFVVANYDVDTYYKNVGANDPRGPVLLPGGKTITITLRTGETLSYAGNYVTLYNHKVSDCQILLDRYVYGRIQDKDKIALKILSIEQNYKSQIAKLTVQVPDATDVVKQFTKLGARIPYSPEAQEYYIISHTVHIR
jgi:hypothetical protein